MTRSDIIAALAYRFRTLTDKDAEVAVKEILDAIGQTLARGDRVEIRGFGSFAVNYRSARTGRNPKTGEAVQVAPKYAPHFKAGKELRELVEQSARPENIKMGLEQRDDAEYFGDSNAARSAENNAAKYPD